MKKGFTLIELLAIIIILAIVSLVATPIILDVVNDSRDKTAFVGGTWSNSGSAGLWYWHLGNASSGTYVTVGSRLIKLD